MERIDPIAPLVAEYFNWLSGHGGKAPGELIVGLTCVQRDEFLNAIDDVNFMWCITAPVRELSRDTQPTTVPETRRLTA